MIFLFRLYGTKFFKDALILLGVILILGVVIRYLVPSEQSMPEIFLALNSFLFGAFFFVTYPLTQSLNWILNLPIRRMQIAIFNILFQFYKIGVLFVLATIAQLIGIWLFPISHSPPVKVVGLFEKASATMVLSSIEWVMLIIFVLVMVNFIFAISPQQFIRNSTGHFITQEKIRYLLLHFKAKLLLIIPAIALVHLFLDSFSSYLVLGPLVITILFALLIGSYLSALKCSRSLQRRFYWGLPVLLVTILIFFYSSAHHHIHQFVQAPRPTAAQAAVAVDELFFLRGFYAELPHSQMVKLLTTLQERSGFEMARRYLQERSRPLQLNANDFAAVLNNVLKVWEAGRMSPQLLRLMSVDHWNRSELLKFLSLDFPLGPATTSQQMRLMIDFMNRSWPTHHPTDQTQLAQLSGQVRAGSLGQIYLLALLETLDSTFDIGPILQNLTYASDPLLTELQRLLNQRWCARYTLDQLVQSRAAMVQSAAKWNRCPPKRSAHVE